MLENRKIILSVQEKENLKALDRKYYRESRYEMNPFIWTLVKLSDGKIKAVIVE
jgi:hypothetical protein